jgi:Ribosome inactivating protein
MKPVPKQLFQKRLLLRLGAIIASASTVLVSPLTALASPTSVREEQKQQVISPEASLFHLIAQNNPGPSRNNNGQPPKIIRVNLLNGADEFIAAINLIRLNQTEEAPHPNINGLTVRRPINRPNTDYFIVAVPFENRNIGFVIRRNNLYLQGYIRNFNPEQVSGTYYYLKGTTVTSVSEAREINPRPLDRDENYGSLFGGELKRGNFNIFELQQSFRNLVDTDPTRNPRNLQTVSTALGRFAVAIPEAVRFGRIERQIAELFLNPNSTLDFRLTHNQYLRNWSRHSSQALTTPDRTAFDTIAAIISIFVFIGSL